jgi:Bifunctional DNA primase/polymerase, N-terminal/Primase C terminal 1 (PriCT-1)/Protein of unknown function (DUF3987)
MFQYLPDGRPTEQPIEAAMAETSNAPTGSSQPPIPPMSDCVTDLIPLNPRLPLAAIDPPDNPSPMIPPEDSDETPGMARDFEILADALRYAARGWNVFPVFGIAVPSNGECDCATLRNCQHPGKHPRTPHGFLDASTNESKIRTWFARPHTNIGIATGAVSGLLVVDIDPWHGGDKTWADLIEKHGPPPDGPVVLSGGGGTHIYFRHPGRLIRSRVSVLGKGIDVRADGGYIVAPSSMHAMGERYRWAEGSDDAVPLPDVPAWVLDLLDATPDEEPVPPSVATVIEEGKRNSTLTSLAGSMRRRGMSHDSILAALLEENRRRCSPSLPEDEVRAIAASIARYSPAGPGTATTIKSNDPAWPAPLEQAAYHGLAGEIVAAIEPHTESDPAALLAQLLTCFGNAAGRQAHFRAEADCHYTNQYVILVGVSSKGRKGTSFGQIRNLYSEADNSWADHNVKGGLSSGEGVIWAVHDEITKREAIKEKGRVTGYQQVVTEEGICDKRLLLHEPEFASVLKVLAREGNTLSAQLRQAWDTGNLRTLTKNSPASATGAHISIIGHVTKAELLRELNSTEAANGFGNRFLWICVRRTKLLPEGGHLDPTELKAYGLRVGEALAFARSVGELHRDAAARELWFAVYEKLSAGEPGLYGAVTSRAEAQTMRLAVLYALLDRCSEIRREHLEAALAFWTYAAASARYIFGDAVGDYTADRILESLRQNPGGMTRTQIADIFGKHMAATKIDQALNLLASLGLAQVVVEQTGGRPSHRWFPAVAG